MRIVSLYFGHDSSVCLLQDGRPIAVIEKERITRKKHDHGWFEVRRILDAYAWTPGSIDCMVINPYIRTTPGDTEFSWSLTGPTYMEREDYRSIGLRCFPEDRYTEHDLKLFGRTYPCFAVDHHLAHIAAGFYSSPFRIATILSADGGGDYRTCAIAHGQDHLISEVEYGWGTENPHFEINIGSTWGSISQHYFGYGRLEGAGKLMGLSSYGKPVPALVEELAGMALTDPLRSSLSRLPRGTTLLDPADPVAQNLAASLQEFTTRAYLNAAQRATELFSADNLVLTGGCSMNCIANTAVHRSGLFAETWVPAQPSDCGLALGQALFVWHHVMGQHREARALSPYLGTDAGGDIETVARTAVDHLVLGKTVGVCVGAAENGPRALGNRSILADPRLPRVKEHINSRVKYREWYRPFAPMVLEEDFDNHFGTRVPSRYMSYVTDVINTELPGVTHVDGTTRPQVVALGESSVARLVLEEWKRRTGLGVLLNTSLNSREPLVDTISDAESMWQRTDLDVLVRSGGAFVK